jgi:hypothetical protein
MENHGTSKPVKSGGLLIARFVYVEAVEGNDFEGNGWKKACTSW